ncbi:MAG TPA: ATP-binding cassette domain-containing protein, partial [Caldisericia bacterium]|nr:ATP-binding cassette domain-containing protein [Caldisericia bacterium]HOL83325.1 ATP-binding cassette domain-containing protein [Caldisericia bacterium]HPP43972.1 ATP-binding cassette domain-containing protein [Caldisericia bacterium]
MENIILKIINLNAYYGNQKVLKNVDLEIYENRVTTILGPSGCGKTTLIRCINRLHELSPGARIEGQILLKGEDLYQIEPMIV